MLRLDDSNGPSGVSSGIDTDMGPGIVRDGNCG